MQYINGTNNSNNGKKYSKITKKSPGTFNFRCLVEYLEEYLENTTGTSEK